MEKVRVVDLGLDELDRHPASWYAGDIEEVPDERKPEEWVKSLYEKAECVEYNPDFWGTYPPLLSYVQYGEPRYVFVFDNVGVPRQETKIEARARKKTVFEFLVDLVALDFERRKLVDKELVDTALNSGAITFREYETIKAVSEKIFEGEITQAEVKEKINAGYKF